MDAKTLIRKPLAAAVLGAAFVAVPAGALFLYSFGAFGRSRGRRACIGTSVALPAAPVAGGLPISPTRAALRACRRQRKRECERPEPGRPELPPASTKTIRCSGTRRADGACNAPPMRGEGSASSSAQTARS